MGYIGPWSNFHELNLDWLLREVKQLRTDVDGMTGAATPSNVLPEMNGTADPGESVNYSRGDHVHPTDTTRAAKSDLDQEVIDRGDADDTLQNNIDAVDAKIKFTSAAPEMDDSSASAGSSDYMARSDHVHPTDTSRASKSEFDTLKAYVEGLGGSASPYDVVPLMDGTGSYGTVGAYSRGDHRHPSDTSKLDTAGGTVTGPLTLEDALRRPDRERFVEIDAVGWLRVADIPAVYGTRVTFGIVRNSLLYPDETHRVTLIYNQAGPSFVEESSKGSVLYINKIRYSDAGKIDIHIDQAYATNVGVYLLEVCAPTQTDEENIRLLSIVGVADAPAGETILSEYTMSSNIQPAVVGSVDISVTSFLSNIKLGGYYSNIKTQLEVYDIPTSHVLACVVDWNSGQNSISGMTQDANNLYVSFRTDTACTVHVKYYK